MADEARAAAAAARDAAARAEAAANSISPPAGPAPNTAVGPAERKQQLVWAKATAQCVCPAVVFVLLYWGITQLFRVVGIFGLSDAPPGLVYADDT